MTLRLDGLRRRYGDVIALDGLSFEVPNGQVVGFLGPNGSGKTTAIRAIFGLVSLDSGTVTWNGHPIGAAERRRFGYMPEERGLYPGMVIQEQIEYLARLHGMSAHDAQNATTTWLERVGIADRATDKVEALSLGNQQRVQLAAALVHEPELLVLDEPLSGLDPAGVDAIGAVLVEQAAAGRGVLFSSHQLDLVEHLCESVDIIEKGRLVASGPVEELETAGKKRLVVRVEGDREGAWAANLPGTTISRIDGGLVRLHPRRRHRQPRHPQGGNEGGRGDPVRLRTPPPLRSVPRSDRMTGAQMLAGIFRSGSHGGHSYVAYVLIPLGALLIIFRLVVRGRRRRRRANAAPRPKRAPKGFAGGPDWIRNDVSLVAYREVRERARSRVLPHWNGPHSRCRCRRRGHPRADPGRPIDPEGRRGRRAVDPVPRDHRRDRPGLRDQSHAH